MKRFTESSKWSDPWFRRLSGAAKMLWFYVLDHCDNVGIVEIDLQLASQDCGIKCNAETVAELGDRIQHIGENKYLIGKFISFQYGKLSPSCRPHEKILDAIESNGLTQVGKVYVYPVSQKDRVSIPYQDFTDRVSDTHKEKEKEKDKEKEQDKNKDTLCTNRAKATRQELDQFCRDNGLYPRDAEYLWSRWEGNGWMNGKSKIKDWRLTIKAWAAQGYLPSQKQRLPIDFWPSTETSQEQPEESISLDKFLKSIQERSAIPQESEPDTQLESDSDELF